eukprot:CAMPEP_0201571800 /NCGR_PEP_ID=MMETSP0190_2-20130828/14734_1 /ASSEMBLY_ACC=CAM_ASM_000263 /TAXON_ID=37353 /ORGANISM="Rosalina sp." /LENGTH=910 /DNA_ID=CAMNT_0047996839 /DNA_START=164 /DNA_END=2896 /DNA_ORIENTATION=-
MSVVGFDLGCQFSKVAVAHRKKIQVVPNELTKLLTPTLTAFSDRERFFGDGALTQYNRNYKNTIAQIKRWLGRKADDPKIQEDAQFWLPGVTTGALPDGRFGISVETSQGQAMFAPEQILSGFLGQLKKFTKGFLEGLKVTDCVIACPSYFDDAQRRALLTAAKLAELKVLRLLEETTAVALNYGILRNLPENETQRVVFFDFGYASTQVAIVDFIKGKLSVRYKSANPFMGGRDIDRSMYEHFRKQWQEKYNVDINTLPKQKLKLIRACEKIKKLLTGNKDAHWTLDCFHDDHDFNLVITREEMEKYATDLKIYDGMLEPLVEALEATKDDKVKIHSCEIIGGPSRVASVQQKVLEVMQKYEPEIKALSTTLNGDECVARGCALMCAMLSPNFRVKEFQVQDILTWPITISYPTEKQADQKIIEQLIMQRGNPQPCTAKVMFNKTQNFVFKLQHPEEYKTKDATVNVEYPMKTNLNIGEFNVQLLPLSEKAVQPPKIKLLLDINKQGLLDWPKASLIEYVKREEPKEEPKKEEPKKEDAAKKEDGDKDKAKDKDNDAEMKDKSEEKPKEDEPKKDSEEKPKKEEESKTDDKMEVDEDDDEANKDGKKKKKDKKKITRDLIITGNFFNELKADAFNKMFEIEANLINVDRIVHETDEAKNDLETYIYGLRDKIDGDQREYIKDSDRETLSTTLTEMEDWVYDEGDKANKTQFLERLKQLKDIGDPMDYKQWEFEHRQQRVTNFKKLIFKYQQWVTTNDEKYIHIGEGQRKEVKKYADDADAWLTNQQIKQDRLKKYETPSLKCKDIDNQYRSLYDNCNKIVNTPKPKPKPKEEEKKDGDKDKKDETTAANGDAKDKKEENSNDNGGDAEMTDKSKEEEPKKDAEQDKAADTSNDDNKDKPKTGVDGMDVE